MTLHSKQGTNLEPVDHLLLPVGGNPLPNAVVGPLLVKPGGRITLLYSKSTGGDTNSIADRTAEVLRRRLHDAGHTGTSEITVEKAGEALEESRQANIWKVTHAVLNGVPNVASVGLNYTCGTKAMSVHIRDAMKHWADEKSRKAQPVRASFTYLSSRDRILREDIAHPLGGGDNPEYDLRAQRVTLQEMLRLQDGATTSYKGLAPFRTAPIAPIAAKSVAHAHRQEGLGRSKHQPDLQKWLNWRRHPTNIPDCPVALTDLTQAGLNADGVRKWAHGDWLEDYVMICLMEANTSFSLEIDDFYMKIYTQFTEGPNVFEVDVIGIRGYQLIGISCALETRINDDDRCKTKLKLMEAITRMQQIGGDEARVAFVTIFNEDNDVKQLVKEAARPLRFEDHVRVFGLSDLQDLGSKL